MARRSHVKRAHRQEEAKAGTQPAADAQQSAECEEGTPAEQDKAQKAGKARGDAAVGEAIGRAGSAATNAARGMGTSVKSGFGAMRAVRTANKKLSQAQAELKKQRQGLDEDRRVLAHREDIERRYPQIMAKQQAELKEADEARKAANARGKKLQAQKDGVSADLERMKADHEARIKPYRNLMDTSRGRSDDAAKSLASVRRNLKDAESQVQAATKRRDQRVSAANQAVDNAKQRLSQLELEYDSLRNDPQAGPGALKKTQAEMDTEKSHIASAEQEVKTITADAQSSVDTAQQGLFNQQRLLKDAEQTAEAAKAEAQSHKTEHDNLYREMQAQEKGLEDKIKLCDGQMKDALKQREAAEKRIAAARQVMQEANDIHDNPATTEGVRERIANEEADVKAQEREVESLSKRAQHLKRETRGARFAFVALIVVAIIVVIVLLYYFVVNPGMAQATTVPRTGLQPVAH